MRRPFTILVGEVGLKNFRKAFDEYAKELNSEIPFEEIFDVQEVNNLGDGIFGEEKSQGRKKESNKEKKKRV